MQQDKCGWLSWKDIGDARGLLYGLAIVSIMAFHYFEWVVGKADSPEGLRSLAVAYNTVIGSIGVDAFVVLSGYGIYHSLNKSFDLRRYFGRRTMRVLVPYAVAGLAFWALKDLWLLRQPIASFAKDYLFVSFVTDGVRTVWYVPFIATMYAMAPAAYKLLARRCPAGLLACLWLLLCIGLCAAVPGFFGHTEVALLRVPAFLLGMGCGRLAQQRRDVPRPVLVALAAIVPLKLALVAPGQILGRSLNVLYGGSLIVLVVLLRKGMNTLVHVPRKCGLIERVGALSYELYLSHVMIRNYLATAGFDLTRLSVYLACLAASVPAALALHRLQRIRPDRQ